MHLILPQRVYRSLLIFSLLKVMCTEMTTIVLFLSLSLLLFFCLFIYFLIVVFMTIVLNIIPLHCINLCIICSLLALRCGYFWLRCDVCGCSFTMLASRCAKCVASYNYRSLVLWYLRGENPVCQLASCDQRR